MMKPLLLITTLCLSFTFLQAQCIKVIDATYLSMVGGREESKSYILEIRLKNNDRVDFSHLMMGEVKLNLEKEIVNKQIVLKAFYFPNANSFPTVGAIVNTQSSDINFNEINLYYKTKEGTNLKKKRIKNWKVKEAIPNQRPQ